MGGAGAGVGAKVASRMTGVGDGDGAEVSTASQPGPSSSSLPVVRAPRTQLSWFLLQPHGEAQSRPQITARHVSSDWSITGLGVLGGGVAGWQVAR